MRRLILLAGCIGVLAVTVVAQHSSRFMQMLAEARRNVREVSVEEVKARLDRSEKFLLIDVREDNEWAEGHVPGAIHIGRGVLEKGIEEKAVDGKTPIVLYCHTLGRRWQPTRCRRWGTRTWRPWRAGLRRGEKRDSR